MLNYSDLFDYFKSARVKLLNSIEKLAEEELTKDRGLSFNSIKDVLIHTIMVEDNWLHYRFPGLGAGTSRKYEDFKDIADVRSYMLEVDEKTSKLFARITSTDLPKQVKRPLPNGQFRIYTLEQVLYHIPIEVTYHYGEIFAEFWKMNLDAPYYSYLDYAKEKEQNP